jgi:hypothetical protein
MTRPEDSPQAGEGSLPLAPRRRKHRGRSRFGNSSRGKLSLIAMFLILRCLDFFIFFEWPAVNKSEVFVTILNNVIWTTALLTAIWFRKSWGRYVLIFFLPLSVISALILLPDFWIKFDADNRLLLIITVTLAAQGTVAWFLMFSRDLDRLTGRGKA